MYAFYSMRLTDFGLSRSLATSNLAAHLSEIGPVSFMAPGTWCQMDTLVSDYTYSFFS